MNARRSVYAFSEEENDLCKRGLNEPNGKVWSCYIFYEIKIYILKIKQFRLFLQKKP